MSKIKILSLFVVIGLFLGISPSLWSQTNFFIKVYATDGSGWKDSVYIGKYTTATNAPGDSINPTLVERELPPLPPAGANQAPDVRLDDPTGLGGYGVGLRVDLRLLVSNIQSDVYRVKFRRSDPEGSVITLSWQAGLASVGGGGFVLTDGVGGINFPSVDMTQQTSFSYSGWNGLTGGFVDILVGDGGRFVSFTGDAIATTQDEKGKISGKSINPKRKPIGSEGQFTFTNSTGGAVDGLYVEWSQVIKSHLSTTPFTTVTPVKPEKPQKITYAGASIPNGGTAVLKVRGDKGKNLLAGKWHWLVGTTAGTDTKKTPADVGTDRLTFGSPNLNNVGEELYTAGAFDPTDGLTVGLSPLPNRIVHQKKWSAVTKTIYKKGLMQHGPAACLSVDIKGKPITKIVKTLPPDKTPGGGNVLINEIVALKVNIGAGAFGKTETAGFGNLIYRNAGSPYNGSTISQIAASADSAFSCVGNGRGLGYAGLATLLNSLNGAFVGPFDTVQFGLGTKVKGVKPLVMVPTLYRTSVESAPVTQPDFKAIYSQTPDAFNLSQNYPNPFNPTTNIEFTLPEDGFVTLKVYNMLGQEVATLLNREEVTSGLNTVEFDASSLSTGVYYYRLVVNDGQFQQVKKMMLVK